MVGRLINDLTSAKGIRTDWEELLLARVSSTVVVETLAPLRRLIPLRRVTDTNH